jgi:hypothetical protein
LTLPVMITLPAPVAGLAESAMLEFLNGDLVLGWAEAVLGL